MNRVRRLVNADAAFNRKLRGQGIGVAVLDTGIARHPDFDKRITGFVDIVGRRRWPYDDCSHGTHVCGILGGSGIASMGKYRGIAPLCRIISVKILDHQGNGNKNAVFRGVDWVIKNKEAYGIRILNISVGTLSEDKKRDMELVAAVEKAWDAGLIVVVAAGNMGPEPMTITVPGNSKKVITVGSSDDCEHTGDKLVPHCYSGRGPTAECICKPDIVAPGSMVIACNVKSVGDESYYAIKSGTSMATPIVSGGIALLLSKTPHLTNVEVKMRLRETARDLGYPMHQQGWGQIDIARLVGL